MAVERSEWETPFMHWDHASLVMQNMLPLIHAIGKLVMCTSVQLNSYLYGQICVKSSESVLIFVLTVKEHTSFLFLSLSYLYSKRIVFVCEILWTFHYYGPFYKTEIRIPEAYLFPWCQPTLMSNSLYWFSYLWSKVTWVSLTKMNALYYRHHCHWSLGSASL